MPVTYDEIPEATMVDALEHHVRESGVHERLMPIEFRLVPAHGPVDKETGAPTGEPALKSKGLPLIWERKIIPLKSRASDPSDVVIYIDAERWAELKTPERTAEMDKALMTIEIVKEDSGAPKVDCFGRPRLETRNPDQVLEVYHDVVNRHGDASSDIQKIRKVMAKHEQLFLTGMGPSAKAGSEGRPPMLN